jgi:hypothetical protein
MQRDEASAKLERQIALINAEEEITRLENEQADVQEEMQDAQKKKAEAAQKAPPSPAGENK